jgi:hypothetical protein
MDATDIPSGAAASEALTRFASRTDLSRKAGEVNLRTA